MQRREDWPERLIETIERHGALPFEFGTSDCLTFPLACVEAMTGVLPWADEHGKTTQKGAAKLLRRHGFKTVADALASLFLEIPVAMAGRGDVGVIEGAHGVSGVVFIDNGAIGKADVMGTRRVPRSLVARAFKVG